MAARRTYRLILCALVLVGACGRGSHTTYRSAPRVPATFKVSSVAFANGSAIPKRFTCDGAGARPPIAWRGVPSTTQSIAVLVEDPDAPSGSFLHWSAWGIDPHATDASVVTHEGVNSAGTRGWTPPCPPQGAKAHHYEFVVYALARPLTIPDGATPSAARAAVTEVVVGRGVLKGSYRRG